MLLAYGVHNNICRYIEVDVSNKENNYGVKFATKTAKLRTDSDLKEVIAQVPTKELQLLKSFAKGLKTYSDNRMKDINRLSKDLDTMAKNKSTGSVSKAILKLKSSTATSSRALVTGAFLSTILDYANDTKSILYYCNEQAKLYKVTEL